MSKFISWLKSIFVKPVKVEPLPKVNTPEIPKVETPKVAPKPILIDEPKSVDGYVIGVDVSHHNKTVDWAAIKKAGYSFAYLKCTEGKGFFDPRFLENVKAAKALGIKVGAYHFFHPGMDAIAQARFFLSKVIGLNLDLIHDCDWEDHDDCGEAAQVSQIKLFVDYLEKETGHKPMIYTGKWYIDQVDAKDKKTPLPQWLANYPLWLSDYSPSSVAVPKPWNSYTLLQTTESGTIDGIAGKRFDLNRITPDNYKKILMNP